MNLMFEIKKHPQGATFITPGERQRNPGLKHVFVLASVREAAAVRQTAADAASPSGRKQRTTKQ